MGAERSYARTGMLGEQFAMITLVSSYPLKVRNLTTLSLSVAEALHLGSACTITRDHPSGEMKLTESEDGGDIGA